MDPRSLYPRDPASNSSATDTTSSGSSIRHRGHSPRIPQDPESDSRTIHSSDAAGSSDKAEAADPRPPIIVRSTSHGTCPILPFTESSLNPTVPPEIRESSSFSEVVLEAVPLTPRPEYDLQDRPKSVATNVSRLSSPDFFAPPLKSRDSSFAGIFDFFKGSGSAPKSRSRSRSTSLDSRGDDIQDTRASATRRYVAGIRDATASSLRSMRSLRVPSMDRLRSLARRPSVRLPNIASQPLQTRSQTTSSTSSRGSSYSVRTYASTSSVDSGRTYLFPGINTTDRFTHRWPRPANLKKLERKSSIASKTSGDFRSISYGESGTESFDVGLGFERVGHWTKHKWCLFLSVLSVLGYSIWALVYAILTWYQTWDHADVMLVADGDVLILATLCACLLMLAALVGLTGTLLNSRPLLAIYALLLWPAFISLLSVGYISYKLASFSLDRKLSMAWSKWYTDAGRAVIQDSMRCCGFSDPTHEAAYGPGMAGGCYPRTHRPGCKGPLLRFERDNLGSLWRAAFSAAPLHIINIIISMLCANHITRTFGTGLLPRGYRLKLADVRADAKNLLQHFVSTRDGAMRLPPLMARTESGMGWRREDRMYKNAYIPERSRQD